MKKGLFWWPTSTERVTEREQVETATIWGETHKTPDQMKCFEQFNLKFQHNSHNLFHVWL